MNYFSTVSAVFTGLFAYDFLKEVAIWLAIKIEQRLDRY